MRTPCSTTTVAKLNSTAAGYANAAVLFFHPEIALRALLKFLPFHKFLEIFIILAHSCAYTILCTALTLVVFAFTGQTIMLLATGAFEISEGFIALKNGRASCGWTPGDILTNFYELIHGKILVFLHELAVNKLLNVMGFHGTTAAFHGAFDVKNVIFNADFDMVMEALSVKHMLAVD